MRKGIFKKPKIALEGNIKQSKTPSANIPNEMCVCCPSCNKMLFNDELNENLVVCSYCNHHFRMNSRQRLNMIADEDSFIEHNTDLKSENILDFPNYDKKLKNSQLESSENEAVITGVCKINSINSAIFVMEPYFMMGSMGTVVGEKITRIFEFASENRLPVIGFCVSGGARMQEGILSLMQMAKVSGAVKKHSDNRLLYITVLTDPTMGGVTASFAMQGDIIIAEPNALVGFAGPRVIEQTIRQKLPDGFQKAEYLLKTGFINDIVERKKLKEYLTKLLQLHNYK
ncbi:MAG: acetyl-CoA carboxylase subunit beta [Clostridiales bacterium GWF2_38_85]|nr:MAG: acetyl-CoA carboxylase subunit beta [Clostridiales bacterium GWF2_38_85]HBL85239.1 acetyl-CoA carboxylase carboxyl transferase subunit beta [Clostridiales bacterium]